MARASLLVVSVLFAGVGSSGAEAGQCDDGIDNDGDGLVDWQYDLGCYNYADPTEGGHPSRYIEDGWTVFEPSKDTRIIYVSSSEGRDSNDGRSPRTPKRTVKAAKALLRNGRPDWLLFKRGDVWKDETLGFWSKSGRAHAEPMVLAGYGDSRARPRFDASSVWWKAHQGGAREIRHLSIVGLHPYFYRKDPKHPEFTGQNVAAFQWLVNGGDILFEDNYFEYGAPSLQLEPTLGFALRRNIFAKAYSLNSHAQGLYTHIKAPLLIEENLFYHGGWSDEFRFVVTPNKDVAAWAAVSDGRFNIELEGGAYSVSGADFTGVRTMDAVAAKIEKAINDEIGGGVTLKWTLGGVFIAKSTRFKSDDKYSIKKYTGPRPGTDIDGPSYINGASMGIPESTVYNRNMYLSAGYGNTTVRGNIDADGASGGVQLRMGGVVEDNLFLQDPQAIVFGHGENPAQSVTRGVIRGNVVLNSRDIDTQSQGTGILLIGTAAGRYNATYARDIEVYNNIVAHNKRSTFNVKAFGINLRKGSGDILIRDNIAYDWHRQGDPADNRGPLMFISVGPGVDNVRIRDNDFQNPERGMLATVVDGDFSGVTMSGNKYYSGSADPGGRNSGWFSIHRSRSKPSTSFLKKLTAKLFASGPVISSSEWFSESGETDYKKGKVRYPDPNRDIASYMRSLGKTPTLEAFIAAASEQSRYNWRKEYTAHDVNQYIRDGFGMTYSPQSEKKPPNR